MYIQAVSASPGRHVLFAAVFSSPASEIMRVVEEAMSVSLYYFIANLPWYAAS